MSQGPADFVVWEPSAGRLQPGVSRPWLRAQERLGAWESLAQLRADKDNQRNQRVCQSQTVGPRAIALMDPRESGVFRRQRGFAWGLPKRSASRNDLIRYHFAHEHAGEEPGLDFKNSPAIDTMAEQGGVTSTSMRCSSARKNAFRPCGLSATARPARMKCCGVIVRV